MELNYEKLLKEKGLTVEELPKRAQVGIKSIKQWLMAYNLATNMKRKINPDLIDKIEANDEWVCEEINNYVTGKKPSTDPLPNTGEEAAKAAAKIKSDAEKAEAEEVERKAKEEMHIEVTPVEVVGDARAGKIDAELKILVNAGNVSMKLSDIKDTAPVTYGIIFEAYEEGGENGVETTHYRLVETSKEVFALTKR